MNYNKYDNKKQQKAVGLILLVKIPELLGAVSIK
jgi:hypothetical protein